MTTSTCFGLKSSWLTFLHYKKNEEKTPVASENEVTKMKSHCQKIWYDTPSSVEVAETLIVITNIASKSHSYWLPCRKKQTSFFRGDMFYPETKIISRLFFFVFERIRIGRIAAIYIHDMLSDKQLFVLELDECSFN